MSLPSATLVLLTSLLIGGCATKEPQSSPAQTQTWHRDDLSTHGPKKKGRTGTVAPLHPDPSSGAMSGSETEWSKVNPRHGGFQ
jgi:hypothetical protein